MTIWRELLPIGAVFLVPGLSATGAQGGGLVRAILDDPAAPFAVRALTRNPDSAKAKGIRGARRRGGPGGSGR